MAANAAVAVVCVTASVDDVAVVCVAANAAVAVVCVAAAVDFVAVSVWQRMLQWRWFV